MIYTKEAYDIDLNELIPELVEIINSQKLSPKLQISKKEYISRINYGCDYLKELRNYKNEPYFIVERNEPSFDYWLGLYISTQKPHLVPLILDCHFDENDNPASFLNHVQHYVLKIIEANIFHNVDDQLREISSWVREKRKDIKQQKNDSIQILNINILSLNIEQTINNIWPKSSSNDSENDTVENIDQLDDKLIAMPFVTLFHDALIRWCEKSSVDNLKLLLGGNQIMCPVVLNLNFKKISLVRPIQELVSRGHMKFNKYEASKWISENFEIRTATGTIKFSQDSTQKSMSEPQNEPKNAQIKYEDWFK